MFHPESNPLAPKSSGPKKPEKELVRVWLGDAAAAEMGDEKSEKGDEDLKMGLDPALIEKEKRVLWEIKRPDEVTLKNIPRWEKLPDGKTLKKDFKFDRIWDSRYRKGRPLSDFTPRPEETLPSFHTKEALSHAKVFDITDIIKKAKENPEHVNGLTTKEVLEAIDEAGYRPATLEELLAYARDYWKPEADLKTLTKEERELQNAQAFWIISLNSVFSDAGSIRHVPYLSWDGAEERKLSARGFRDVWGMNNRFLVLRKAFSS